jgi:hypothetical protein
MKASSSGVNSNGVNSGGENKRVESPFSFKSSSSTGIHGAACTYSKGSCVMLCDAVLCCVMLSRSSVMLCNAV